ncbi:PAS domain S-box protein [Archangium primigenium]|uniref:sensor histidine kinase n=1 Tax=[Archangium] primigenium TaxID=2792470 RepID=UPI0019569A93|nr:PAS domain S-box protein [Archangium primigenium]MBM7113207.1 PAS domain S-box protein [Archangium primigenium]
MMQERERQAVERMFPGGGEMGARMRAHDWSATPLGPVSTWPRELRTVVGMVLANHFPMNLLWGPDLLQLYNDAYVPLMGDKHPHHLAQPCRVTWAEIWPQVGPRFDRVLTTGISATHQQTQLFLHRHGFLEESYFTDSYAPLWGESGQVEGVLVTVVENTETLLAERRLRALKDLAAETVGVRTWSEARGRVGEVLGRNPLDVPFALLYLVEDAGRSAELSLAVGMSPGERASPARVALEAPPPGEPWPLADVLLGGEVRLENLEARLGPLPGGPWPETPREALVLPLRDGERSCCSGVLVLGASPRLRLDAAYQDYLRLMARQVSTVLARCVAEEARSAAHQRATDILESLGDAFLAVDRDWRLTHVNSNLERLTKLDRERMLGQRLWDLWPGLEQPPLNFWSEYQRSMRERVPVRFLDAFAGHDIWTETRGFPTPDGGLSVFIRDVSEQKRAEAERDRIFNRSRDLLCEVDFTGLFRRVNPAWSQVLGWSEAELLRMGYQDILHPESLDTCAEHMRTLGRGEAVMNVDVRLRHVDGSYRWLSWNVTPEPNKELVSAVGRDVTEARRAAEAQRQRSDFEKQLIGIVSHDLRNPLGAISLGAQALLRREVLDAAATRAVVRILSVSERATRLVRDLLDFTQARLGGGLPIQVRTLDFHVLTRQALDEVQMGFPERDFRLEQRGDGRGEWDGDRISQLLTNLVTNAAKYSPAPSSVSVSTRGEGDGMVLEVHNQGMPIAPELRTRLFQPLQRGQGQNASAARSVGLGLYIVKHIVDAHGGAIEVRSTDEEGTTFTVRLPRHPPGKSP